MQNREQRNFSLGLNLDDEERLIQDGEYLYAKNLLSGVAERGVLVNMKGSELVPFTLPTGNNKCIGSLKDIKRNAIIYFVFNDLGNHSILHYLCATNTIEPIFIPKQVIIPVPVPHTENFTTDFLGFTEFNKIHSSNIIDDILLWTDNNVPPRKINIQYAKDFLNGVSPTPSQRTYSEQLAIGIDRVKQQFVNAIKYAPVDKPTHQLGYDPARKTNFIRGFMIQCRYRWIYDDNEPSRWSTGSYVSQPIDDENINGPFADTNANNFLEVTVFSGHPTVRQIEVCFRFNNNSEWYKMDTPIQVYDQFGNVAIQPFTNYTFNFYNDQVLQIVGVEESIEKFDNIPNKSKTQDIIDGNRLVYSNNLEGYDNPTLDVTTSVSYRGVNMGTGSLVFTGINLSAATDAQRFSVWSASFSGLNQINAIYLTGENQGIILPRDPSLLKTGTVITFDFVRTDSATYNYSFQFLYTLVDEDLVNYPINLQDNLYDAINTAVAPVFIKKSNKMIGGVLVYYIVTQTNISGPPIEFTSITNFNAILPTVKLQAWKTGSIPKLGIVYYDIANRDGGVVTDLNLSPYIQYPPEFVPNATLSASVAYKPEIEVTINHTPPIWAERYQFVYAGNNLRKYVQFLVKSDAITGMFTLDSAGNFNVDVNYLIGYITVDTVQTSVSFEFEVGDRLRFIANAEKYLGEYIETTVLAYHADNTILTVAPFNIGAITNNMTVGTVWNGHAAPTVEWTQVEMFAYKPTTENLPYFEMGEVYTIIDPNTATRRHQGNVQSQTSTLPAIVSLNRGDCYIYRRWFNTRTKAMFVESEFFSDFTLLSNNIDISRVQAVLPNMQEKRYEQMIRHGGRYFPNTNTNLLLSFGASDYTNMETTYGPVNKVISVGEVLKILQTKKLTSMYIDRNMIFTADGNSQVTLSDRVFGTKYPSETDFGCEHPESVFKDDRQVFWFDVNTGSYIQDSANGPFPISNYKAATYFREKAKQIQNKANVFVYSGIDNLNNTINVTFSDESGLGITTSETIMYNAALNRWTSFADYIPEYMGQSAMVFVSFKNGELWRHNTLDTRNNFFGVQYDSVIRFVANVEPYTVKTFDSLAVDSNEIWSSPTQGMIRIEPNQQFPNGMETRLIAAKFRNKEGVFYSDFMRDMNSPNQPSPQVALLEGRKMRGHCLIVELKNSSTIQVKILGVIVYSTLSRIS